MDADDLDLIDWSKLSIDSLWTISRVVIPMTEGESQIEVARRLGLPRAHVGKHMARLRAEILEQLEAA